MKTDSFKNRRKAYILMLALCLLVFASCEKPASENAGVSEKDPALNKEPASYAGGGDADDSYFDHILSQLSLEEKVGQMFIIRPDQTDYTIDAGTQHSHYSSVKSFSEPMKETLKDYPVGGFAVFDKNIESASQLLEFTEEMRQLCRVEPFISVDEEPGVVTRLAHAPSKGFRLTQYKSAASIGASKDPEKAREAGSAIGKYLKEYGFNLDFAPVADINTNPKNIVIGDRAFGSDPKLVSGMVCAFIDGLHEGGVLTSTKHFPGHGDTSADTHSVAVSVTKTWDELKAAELVPFIDSADITDFIMIAHIMLPNVTDDGLPASLSKELITDRLRGELGYGGLVITDALVMSAIQDYYSSEEAGLLAVKAGVDVLLAPLDYKASFDAIVSAVKSGEIPESRIDESILRILKAKASVCEGPLLK